ncbi:uncharacterized protein [Solanum tuberosum]|uniref:uncharacterized protein n=1 Tax=Solanum tuberosum TaxID=4113 RepID=UPI00073A08D1|nr:PREDICTED: uncharacterized protein LOC107062083 [Solanum tuberosum]
MNNVSRELLSGIMYASSAHKVWVDLNERLDKVDGSRVFHLHTEINNLTQGTSSVSSYFSKMKELWEEFDALMPCPGCECVESKKYIEHYEYQRLLQFLVGLNDSYVQCRSQIMMTNPIPSLNKAYSMVISEESHRSLGKAVHVGESMDGTTLFSNRNKITGNQRSPGGSYKDVENNFKPRKKSDFYCDHCGMRGHTIERCWKVHGYPSDTRGRRRMRGNQNASGGFNTSANAVKYEEQQAQEKDPHLSMANANETGRKAGIMFTQDQYEQLIKLINKDNVIDGKNVIGILHSFLAKHNIDYVKWIVDSGATNHMTYNKNLLSDIRRLDDRCPRKVYLPDGNATEVSCIGSCDLEYGSKVTNVFGKVKGIGRVVNELYRMQLQLKDFQKTMVATVQSKIADAGEDLAVWHQRLGHSPDKVLEKIPNMKFNSSSNSSSRIKDCTICPLARQRRLSFPTGNNRLATPLEIIHADVWGPYRVCNPDGSRYFLTLVDDHSRMTWIFLLKLKSDVIVILKQLFALIKPQFSATVKVFRSDNGTEFFNSE